MLLGVLLQEGYGAAFRDPPLPVRYGPHILPPVDGLDVPLATAMAVLALLLLSAAAALPGFNLQTKRSVEYFGSVIGLLAVLMVLLCGFLSQGWYSHTVRSRVPFRPFDAREVVADVGVHVGLDGVNVTMTGVPPVQLGHHIRYEEHFPWDGNVQGRLGFGPFASRIARAFRESQFRGVPLPVQQVAEWFILDGEGARWGRYYRMGGYYCKLMLYFAALSLAATAALLAVRSVRTGAMALLSTGVWLVAACVVNVRVSERLVLPLRMPFRDAVLEPRASWAFYWTLIAGVLCITAGAVSLAFIYSAEAGGHGGAARRAGPAPLRAAAAHNGEDEGGGTGGGTGGEGARRRRGGGDIQKKKKKGKRGRSEAHSDADLMTPFVRPRDAPAHGGAHFDESERVTVMDPGTLRRLQALRRDRQLPPLRLETVFSNSVLGDADEVDHVTDALDALDRDAAEEARVALGAAAALPGFRRGYAAAAGADDDAGAADDQPLAAAADVELAEAPAPVRKLVIPPGAARKTVARVVLRAGECALGAIVFTAALADPDREYWLTREWANLVETSAFFAVAVAGACLLNELALSWFLGRLRTTTSFMYRLHLVGDTVMSIVCFACACAALGEKYDDIPEPGAIDFDDISRPATDDRDRNGVANTLITFNLFLSLAFFLSLLLSLDVYTESSVRAMRKRVLKKRRL